MFLALNECQLIAARNSFIEGSAVLNTEHWRDLYVGGCTVLYCPAWLSLNCPS
jgi:hypothetical protein